MALARWFQVTVVLALAGGCTHTTASEIHEENRQSGALVDASYATSRPFVCGFTSQGPDSDGDGFARTSSGQENTALGCFLQNHAEARTGPAPDCNDFDPETFQIAFRDWDGDGFGDLEEHACVGEIIPDGYVTNFDDCYDFDAEINTPEFIDEDGDGFFIPRDERCVTKKVPHHDAGTATKPNLTDCNDDDPEVHPDKSDFPGDGVDSNCDRVDGVNLSRTAGLHEGNVSSSNPVCSQETDLYFALLHHEDPCSAEREGALWYASVGNRGGIDSEGAVFIYETHDEIFEFPLPPLQTWAPTPALALGVLPHGGVFYFRTEGENELCNWDRRDGLTPEACIVIR